MKFADFNFKKFEVSKALSYCSQTLTQINSHANQVHAMWNLYYKGSQELVSTLTVKQ